LHAIQSKRFFTSVVMAIRHPPLPPAATAAQFCVVRLIAIRFEHNFDRASFSDRHRQHLEAWRRLNRTDWGIGERDWLRYAYQLTDFLTLGVRRSNSRNTSLTYLASASTRCSAPFSTFSLLATCSKQWVGHADTAGAPCRVCHINHVADMRCPSVSRPSPETL
jgi:hypothetical protein